MGKTTGVLAHVKVASLYQWSFWFCQHNLEGKNMKFHLRMLLRSRKILSVIKWI